MFAPVSDPIRSRQPSKGKRSWPSKSGMEVVSINEFERHQLDHQDRIMESAVDQLEGLTRPKDETAQMVVRFGEMKVDDSLPRLFEFDAPTTCRRWPGLRFGSFCLHKQIPKANSKMKSRLKKPSVKKHERLDDIKHGVHPRKAATHKPKKARIHVPAPAMSLPIASRNPPLHLMALPAEVKNEIWTLLCVRSDPIEAQLRLIQTGKRGRVVTRRFPQEPSLAAANKQLRKEVLSLFYGLNKFVFETSVLKALKDLDMTNIATIEKWKPRSDVVSFISQVDIRLAAGGAGSMVAMYEIRRLTDAAVTITVDYRSARKKGQWSKVRGTCLCGEEAIAQFGEDTCGKEDLVGVVMALLRRRKEVASTSRVAISGACGTCGLEVTK